MKYEVAYLDSSMQNPFSLPSDMIESVSQLRFLPPRKRAIQLFLVLSSSIKYGEKKKWSGYSNAKEVWQNGEGVCGEMSYVYVTCARSLGMRSNYVHVREDFEGKKVNHACAGVWLPQLTLADIAYRRFGILHRDYEILSDNSVLENHMRWRKQYKPQGFFSRLWH